ncbi:hypothetical protein [Kineosporia succinea]|uniref:ANTAR domain-containing protein n=1 Tax=Kineosporia succinea TaxID=84632 RepID=A0ABT9NZ27_9ACTN|nr:hypothetical protein [Kineosporia succinea]MDP9825694.1 hypothetical protein [Kineosporia succinea]
MDLADDTVARLNELAELSGADLLVLFRDLVRSAASSSSSCVAVIITLNQEPPFYALDDRLRSGATTARSSLRAQITTAGPDQHVHSVIFLADAPGEYSHLASLFLDGFAGPTAKLDRLVIDQDLDAAAHLPEPDGAGDAIPATDRLRTINQAIGFLLERGLTPEEGYQELVRRARADHGNIYDQAVAVLNRAGHEDP